jgi:hypothetical protein
MSLSDEQFAGYARDTRGGGGFTVNAQTGREPTSGISVGVPGHEARHPLASLSGADIQDYAASKDRALSQHPQRHLGGWAEVDDAYLDVSKVHADTPVGRQKARVAMVRNDQIAGYDIGQEKEVRNPFHPVNQDPLRTDDRESRRAWMAQGAHKINPDQFSTPASSAPTTGRSFS